MLTRNSFLKSLLVLTAVPQLSFGSNPELEEPTPIGNAKGIAPTVADAIIRKYKVVPSSNKPGAFYFIIGDERYIFGVFSNLCLWGLKFATKERHMIIYKNQGERTPIQAVRVDGKWQYTSCIFPRDFPIEDFAAAVDSIGQR